MKILNQSKNTTTFMPTLRARSAMAALMLCISAVSSHADVNVLKGWNLLGNASEVAVATALANSDQVISVWAWDSATSNWKFYSPSKNFTDGGAAYASSKGYTPLTKVAAFQGFWVNAATDFVLPIKASSSTSVTPPIAPFLSNTSLSNLPFFLWSEAVGGSYAGERQSSFVYLNGNNSTFLYSGDDTFTKLTFLNKTQTSALRTTHTGITVTDTFSQKSQSVNCPTSTVMNSLSTVNGGMGLSQMYYQNIDSSSTQCEKNKTELHNVYPIDTNFTATSLKGKTLKVAQICDGNINQVTITTDASGNFSISGTICSIRQQNYVNAINTRNVSNPTVANGTMADVTDFPNLVRLIPAGYNATMRAAYAPTMLLSRSVDGLVYYFNISDGNSPGQLAGGLLNFVSVQ